MTRYVAGFAVIALSACVLASDKSLARNKQTDCLEFLPSNYLPANEAVDIYVSPQAQEKHWMWGARDYSRADEFARSGSLYSYDQIRFSPQTICAVVDGSKERDLLQMGIPRDANYIVIKDGAGVSLKNISAFSNLKAINIVRTPVKDVLSSPPSRLNGIVLIDSGVDAKDLDYLPHM